MRESQAAVRRAKEIETYQKSITPIDLECREHARCYVRRRAKQRICRMGIVHAIHQQYRIRLRYCSEGHRGNDEHEYGVSEGHISPARARPALEQQPQRRGRNHQVYS